MHEGTRDKEPGEVPLYVESVDITELIPGRLNDAQFDAALLRNFLNSFNNRFMF